ncbi:MAG: hypothetical protein IPJ89_02520 [Candidatus Iainarchaeum archaeon]|uniref:Transcription regulator TrmB N-terminal domain-containing protein n=1 Tax=Candidatus Iainarchaeum sp. TaxID=3101447 RepID=A0A7T9DKN0_9ARCH|nr:MAG: hypothetical protein IPJ89_02520 [Candidatus Diapherotrites archaeon]
MGVLTLTTISFFTPSHDGLIALFVHFHFEAMVLIGLLGVGIGGLSFYLLSQEIKEKSQTVKSQSQLLLSFLTPQEKECVLFLAKNGNESYQSDLAKLPGMTRLKAHRIVTKLLDRKIIHISSHGKANKLTLSEEWKSGLAENN